jgi:hypothetical protein
MFAQHVHLDSLCTAASRALAAASVPVAVGYTRIDLFRTATLARAAGSGGVR